jgi:hypothetical protein
MADHGSPNVRPAEEAGDLSDTAPREEVTPQDDLDFIESTDQQMEDPFVANRFRSERAGHNALLVFFVTLLFFAGGMVLVNVDKGSNVQKS